VENAVGLNPLAESVEKIMSELILLNGLKPEKLLKKYLEVMRNPCLHYFDG